MDRHEKTIKKPTEDGQACKQNKMFEEQCGNKHETIIVVSLLFIKIVIHYHCLALRVFMSSQNQIPTHNVNVTEENSHFSSDLFYGDQNT